MLGFRKKAVGPTEETFVDGRVVSLPILIALAFVIGIVAALGAVFFRMLISFVHNLMFYGQFNLFYDANQFDPISPLGPLVILVPVVGGLIVVWMVQTFAPEAKGHGVPEVMYAIYHNKGNVRGIVAIVKSFASAISIGSGASVGREGPIIQIGASFGSTLARRLRLARWQKITLLSAGAGAGIAATFNTPLGGVMFAVELLLPEVSNRTFLPVVVATATATSIGRVMLGLEPAFFVPAEAMLPGVGMHPTELAAFAILGILAGVASWAFIKLLAFSEDFFPTIKGGPYIQNVIGMLSIGVMAYGFQVFTGHAHTSGVGYSTIQSILEGNQTLVWLLIALFVGKLLATAISLGSGASGGVFSPSLFIGASLGAAVGAIGSIVYPAAGFPIVEFAVVGMGALVGGATGASMTAIVMIFEMTRDYNVIVPLVLAVALAVGVRRALIEADIYTIKLRNRGRPIPTNRHTNMYLVRQAQELMSKQFVVLPIDTPVKEVLEAIKSTEARHIVVTEENRIAGFARLAGAYTPDRFSGETLRSMIEDDFVIATETNILNSIISRMNQRDRSLAIVVCRPQGVPRPDDIVGVIDSREIARAVISNHYD